MVQHLYIKWKGARYIYFSSLYHYLNGLAQQILHFPINVGGFFSLFVWSIFTAVNISHHACGYLSSSSYKRKYEGAQFYRKSLISLGKKSQVLKLKYINNSQNKIQSNFLDSERKYKIHSNTKYFGWHFTLNSLCICSNN